MMPLNLTYMCLVCVVGEARSPYESAGFLSRLTFTWVYSLIAVGWKRPLELDDLFPLRCILPFTIPLFHIQDWMEKRPHGCISENSSDFCWVCVCVCREGESARELSDQLVEACESEFKRENPSLWRPLVRGTFSLSLSIHTHFFFFIIIIHHLLLLLQLLPLRLLLTSY